MTEKYLTDEQIRQACRDAFKHMSDGRAREHRAIAKAAADNAVAWLVDVIQRYEQLHDFPPYSKTVKKLVEAQK